VAIEIESVSDGTFASEVLASDLPVVVDFWAPWCGPCRMISPMLASIGADHAEKLRVVKMNIDENPGTVGEYSIQSVPTLNVFSGGQVVKQITGGKSKSMLLKELAEFL
jgi:thioredoxin 1